MKRILLILLLGITAFASKSQISTGPIRINKYLVDSSDGSFFRLYHDSTRLGAWGLVGSGSGGGGGSITLAGQNYLSLAGSVLTANAVNLSGGNVTGTLAAARVPAFTGVIQNSAGSLTTSFVAGSIVNADINASAAISYSKLNLANSVTNGDLAGSIAYSKLALTGAILNADLAGSIAQSKITGLVTDLVTKQNQHWQRKGVVLTASEVSDEGNVFEPTVIIEGNPQILTELTTVFKMWFTGGWDNADIWYAESPDGVSWTRSDAAVLENYARSSVIKVGSTYYMTACEYPSQDQVDAYTSSDGITWTLANDAIVTAVPATFTSDAVGNTALLYEPLTSTFYMLYDGLSSAGWSIGVATSPDFITWTPQGSGAVISGESQGAPFLKKVGSTYYCWLLATELGEVLPTDFYRYRSTDMLTWVKDPSAITFPRRMEDEGVGSPVGQVADPALVEAVDGSSVYLFYAASRDGSASSGGQQIKVAVFNAPFSELIQTDEGDGGDITPAVASGSSQFDDVTGGINYGGGNVGVGNNTPTMPIDVLVNSNTAKALKIKNESAGTAAIANVSVQNDTYGASFGITGTGYTPYGALGASNAHIYASNDVVVMSDGAGKVVKIAGEGGAEVARFGVSSSLNYMNWGATLGSSGYGFRNNGGTMEFKNSGGTWAEIGSGGGSSQWVTFDANTIIYTGASGNSSAQVNSPAGFVSYLQTLSGDGVMTRLQSNASSGFSGTLTNHPFSLYANSVESIKMSTAGDIQFPVYGAGTLVTDGSGNITASSDARLKNIQSKYTTGLDAVLGLNPVTYKWNEKSGLDTKETYAGFIAQNVKANIPFGTGVGQDGMLTLQDRAIVAALVNSIKELNAKIEKLEAELKKK